MKTYLNDPQLSKLLTEIHKNHDLLERYLRDRYENSLFCALMLLRDASEQAMERLNKLKWPRTTEEEWKRIHQEPMGG